MPRSHTRTGVPRLTRQDIIDEALRRAARHELGTLTLRGLAEELEVSAMALYRHVRDKDEILEHVADALLAAAGLPERTERWRPFLKAMAASLRGVLSEHPEIVELVSRRPLTTPAARARLGAATDALHAAGFSHDDAIRAYAAVHTYTVGFCALEAGRRRDGEAGADPGADPVADTIASFVTEEQFHFGLRVILDGLGPDDG